MAAPQANPSTPVLSQAPKLPLNLGARDFGERKYEYYAWMRESAPVCPARVSLLRMQVVSRYEDCVALVKDPRFVRNRTTAMGGKRFPIPMPKSVAMLAQSMIQEDDPEHRRLRGLVNQAFKPAAIGRLETQIEELVDGLLDGLEGRSTVDLMEHYALPIPVRVIQGLLGIGDEDMPRFRDALKSLTKGFSGFRIMRTMFLDLPRSVRFVREVIAHKRENPGDDILTGLIAAEEEGDSLSEDELVSMCFLLVVAGYETTSHLITNGALTLLQHPDSLSRLRREPESMGRAVEEILRYRGPVQGAKFGYAREDVTWHGVEIKKGTAMFPAYGAANHDPEVFDHPEVFDIDRDPNHHLGFGHGMHFCLGAQLARLETRIALRDLIERYPKIRLAVPENELKLQQMVGWHRYEALPVRLA